MCPSPKASARTDRKDFIPLCIPHVRGNEWTYVRECLDTGWVSSAGVFVERFEQQFAAATGARYAVATVNGTSALHVALLVSGVEADDEVLVSTLTFIAPANAIRYIGAWPVFVDAEPRYWQMDPLLVARFLERQCVRRDGSCRNRTTGRRVRAIVPVHILGHPVDMEPILELADRYGLTVIEDATESLGAYCRGKHVGSIGTIGCFSFNGNKLLTTGGGGMIVTDKEKWADKARYLTTQAKDDPIEYVHGTIGFNYRLTNIQAAVGVAQLEQMTAYLAAKRRIADAYRYGLNDIPGIVPMAEAGWAESAWWMYTALFRSPQSDSRTILKQLNAEGIQTRPLWQPLHLSPAHRGSEYVGGTVAETLYREALSLPCSVGLTSSEQYRVIRALERSAGIHRSPVCQAGS